MDATTDQPTGLTDLEVDMLTLEQSWWKHPGAKDTAIRARFDVTSTVYYMRLNRLIDKPAAEAHDPLLVRRLRRLRAARAQQRSAKRLGFEA